MNMDIAKLTLPASARSDGQRLAACQRILRKLADEFNGCGLSVGPELEGRRADIHERTLRVCRTLLPLRVRVRAAKGWKLRNDADGIDPRESAAKERALADRRYDAELKDNPILKSTARSVEFDDPPEDLNTYDWTTDPNGRFTVSVGGDQVSVAGLQKNEDAYGYKDFGVGHFVDFTHLFTTSCSTTAANQAGFFCVTATELDDFCNNTDAAGSFWTSAGAFPAYQIRHQMAGVNQDADAVGNLAVLTDYYVTYGRAGSAVTCKVYSNAARTVQVGVTASIDDDGTARPYFMPAISFNSGAAQVISYIVRDIDLQEVGGGAFYYREMILKRRLR